MKVLKFGGIGKARTSEALRGAIAADMIALYANIQKRETDEWRPQSS